MTIVHGVRSQGKKNDKNPIAQRFRNAYIKRMVWFFKRALSWNQERKLYKWILVYKYYGSN
jgi:hypothetical protein